MAGTLTPIARWAVYDSNGDPLNGGKLYTYASGTDTPQDTFSDVALLVPNPNPVIASSSGVLGPIYLNPNLSYKYVLRSSTDALIWTQDTIPASPSAQTNPASGVNTANLRLTLTAGVPVTVTDVLAATSVKVEPYLGNRVDLYDGSAWNQRVVTASSIPLPVAADTLYDVFCYDSGGVPTYELLAWTNDTTRATALTLQDGIRVKTGAVTRRYLGSVRTTAVAGQTEDSIKKRYLFNEQNRVLRTLRRMETTATWTYTTATTRQANANTANQVDVVVGSPDALLDLMLIGINVNSTGGIQSQVTIGEDSTSVVATECLAFQVSTGAAANINQVLAAYLKKYPAVGRHYYVWQEFSAATGTTTWAGSGFGVGLSGWIQG